jgi:hypothetical protein
MVSLVLSWILFPLVLAAIGVGWGTVAERLAGTLVQNELILPLGLAGALVVAGTLTAFSSTAPAAVWVVAAGALVGLVSWVRRPRLGRWAMLAAVGVLLAYGAPVLLSGQATFTGFIKLDDTATWFNVIDHVMSHGRSVAGLTPSTYTLVYTGDVGPGYPLGAFMLPGVARALTAVDIAWVFQPYLACCAAAMAMCLHALVRPMVRSAWMRAVVALIAAQPALLYGYSLWGGIKELTAAFLLVLGVALIASIIRVRPTGPRALVPLAIASGALIQTLGVGAAGWVLPAFALLAASWLSSGRRSGQLRAAAGSIAWLAAMAAALVIPVWVALGAFFSNDANLFSSGETIANKLGNLIHALSVFQVVGIWPVGDFRVTAPTLPSVLLIALALAAAGIALWWAATRRREPGLPVYVAVALAGCGLIYLAGATPWVVGKTLAISSPALLTAALAGAAALAARRRVGLVVLTALAGGVIWSNVLAYHDTQLAPRGRLAELERIGGLLDGKGPTFVNQYEVYADRHFLRDGAPVEPAEYRLAFLPLKNGALLTKSAQADLDSFPISTLEPYRSIVTERSPSESRPPSDYRLVWNGRYYQLWERPVHPAARIIEHVPLGESSSLPYCGMAENSSYRPECSVDPVATPPCAQIEALGRRAGRLRARLVGYQRSAPIVARGDQLLWPAAWVHDPAAHTLAPTVPATALGHIAVAVSQRYELWLGGSFGRGFRLSVDGHAAGAVKDELSAFGGYVHVADLELSAGVHSFALTYPNSDLAPGSGESGFTWLSAIVLEPAGPRPELISAPSQGARSLCGRPLDWIEIVT